MTDGRDRYTRCSFPRAALAGAFGSSRRGACPRSSDGVCERARCGDPSCAPAAADLGDRFLHDELEAALPRRICTDVRTTTDATFELTGCVLFSMFRQSCVKGR